MRTDGSPRRLAELITDRLPAARPGMAAVTPSSGFVIAANQAAQEKGVSAAALVRQVLNGHGGGNARLVQGNPPADPQAALEFPGRVLAEPSTGLPN